LAVVALAVVVAAAAGYLALSGPPAPAPSPALALPPEPPEATAAQVDQFCGACHATPAPADFPRGEWRKQGKQSYAFFRESNRPLDFPSIEGVARYYESRAPADWPPLQPGSLSDAPPVRFGRTGHHPPGRPGHPGVSNVNLVHLFDDKKLDVLV